MRRDLFDLHAALEQEHWWFAGRRRIMRDVVRQVAPPRPGALALDVGCGTGANIAALAGDYECVGIDTSEDAIRLARERFPAIRFVHGYAPADVAEEIRRATVVTIMDVIEHVPDDFAIVSSLLAEMPVGSHLLITVPAEEALWSEHDVSFGHYRRYHAARLAQVWRDLPVTARLLSYFNSRMYPVVKTVRTLGRLRGGASGRGGTDLSMPPAPANRVLTSLFAGESARLRGALDGRGRAYARGVSLLAVLRREAGSITPRQRPADVAADLHDPVGAAAT